MTLFNSPPDSQQIEVSGEELNKINFSKECYTKDVAELHDQLLIHLDTKTSDCLRLCSKLVGPGPAIIYVPSSQANITEINNEREKFAYTRYRKIHFKWPKKLLKICYTDFLIIFCEKALYVRNGTWESIWKSCVPKKSEWDCSAENQCQSRKAKKF